MCGLSFEATIVGGAALALLGVTSRQTRDRDVRHSAIPGPTTDAARAFALAESEEGSDLDEDWLNPSPASLADVVPDGWRSRTQIVFSGNAITLHCVGRRELLMSKLFARCDRGIDLADCVALEPTAEELEEVCTWVELQDGNPDWPEHVRETLRDLSQRLGHGLETTGAPRGGSLW